MEQPQAHLPPTTLVLSDSDSCIRSAESSPFYKLSTAIDALTYKDSSFYFSRAIDKPAADSDALSTTPTLVPEEDARLFNVVHPISAEYRTDIPAHYFLTCSPSAPSSVGNVKLIPASKSLLSRQVDKFKAAHCPGRTASSSPLFSDDGEQILFVAAKQRFGKGYIWSDVRGKEVAREEEHKEGAATKVRKLVISSASQTQAERDALAALWVLKRWQEVAEEKGFQKEALDKMGPSERAHIDMKWTKRAGAMGGLAAAGAC